jgi:hypothetical protein
MFQENNGKLAKTSVYHYLSNNWFAVADKICTFAEIIY